MINVRKSVQDFNKLSKEEKIKRLKSMLEIVKEEWNIFDDLYKLLEIDPDISEQIINSIYQAMIKAMYSIQVEEMEKQIEKMEKIKEKIKSVTKEEYQEKQEAEKILDLI